jgi:hypothetical protein
MENIIETIRQALNEHSMDVALFVSGSLGALISDSGKEIKLTKKQRVVRMGFGGITAIFSTQLVVELLKSFTNIELSNTASAGVGFYIGHIGLAGITKLMIKYSERKKK